MRIDRREDDFDARRLHLEKLSDDELHARFWSLAAQITAPLIDEARRHTSPAIERSVLLRMGFSSMEAKALVTGFLDRELLCHGAGRLILELATARGISVREAGEALMRGELWEELAP